MSGYAAEGIASPAGPNRKCRFSGSRSPSTSWRRRSRPSWARTDPEAPLLRSIDGVRLRAPPMARPCHDRLLSALLVSLLGCHAWRPATAPYAARIGPGATDSTVRAGPFAGIARAVRIPPLGSVVLPSGSREIRLSDWYPMLYGSEVPYLRILEADGHATGELLEWWGASPSQPSRERGALCSDDPGQNRVCLRPLRLPRGVTWKAVADSLQVLGAWTITQNCEQSGEPYISDAGELLMQILHEAEYRTYRCNAPTHRQSAVGRQAAAIYAFFHRLAGKQ